MDVFDLADNLRAEFQEKGVSNEEFLLKIAETYDIKRVFVSSVFAFGIGKILLRDRGLEPSNFDCMQFSNRLLQMK